MDAYFLKEQIQRIPGKKISSTKRVFILCPFHQEQFPSGCISIDQSYPRGMGTFRCWGCGKTAAWNEVAEKLGLKKVNGHNSLPRHAPKIDLSEVKAALMGREEDKLDDFDFFEVQEDWRGFDRDFLREVGAKLIYHDKSGTFSLWFPVIVNKKQVGFFRARMRKEENQPSYLNKSGGWVKSKGLFPFDYALQLMKKKKLITLVLTEGPRDALRLLSKGIPAVAILGTNNWTDSKMHTIEVSPVKRLVIMMDGDKPGRKATLQIWKMTRLRMKTRIVKLWRVAEKLGRKIDPNNAPREVFENLQTYLR